MLKYPVIKPAIANLVPRNLAPGRLILDKAVCPQITAGIPAKIEKQVTPRTPSTRLHMASRDVLDLAKGNGGGWFMLAAFASLLTALARYIQDVFVRNGL
jgi:hypothetical protein